MFSLGAEIKTLTEMAEIRPTLKGKVVLNSGGFDPIHPGHISCIQESVKLGQVMIVVVNGDHFLTQKKGAPFQDLATRVSIVSSIRGVDYVVPYETKEEMSVIKPLEMIKPDIYAKGGDRVDIDTIPEWQTCQDLNIHIETNVGSEKLWSSSWFLNRWNKNNQTDLSKTKN